ncbi:MAG TPA: DUF305 domain-containing protein, partial [Longimicrobiales bacterium]
MIGSERRCGGAPVGGGLVGRAHRLAFIVAWLSATACAARGGTDADRYGVPPADAPAPVTAGHAAHHARPAQPDTAAHEPAAARTGAEAAADAPAAMASGAQGHAHAAMLPATPGPGYTVADVRFMQGMIGHHAQAIVMAGMAETHGAGDAVRRLARKIDISQRDEIEMMERWLAERGQAVPDEVHRHAMRMPGMLTPEQMARLDAARGPTFDRLFLTYMIQHHRGALEMVATLFDSPGAAQDPEIFRFAADVDADQHAEIYTMQ